jgi:hypothetical protein
VCDLADLRPDLMRAIDDQLQGGRFAAAFSWREDGHHEACHPDIVEPRFRSAGAVPEGTAFFSQEHGRHLGSVFRYVGAPDDPTPGGHS